MIQWLLKGTINIMGKVYVILDKMIKHKTGPILGIDIDEDFESMSRKQLCRYIEVKFEWEDDMFWALESTQKIRVCCQIARNNKFKGEKK